MENRLYRLRKFVKELEKIRGRHTELVSVYIPSDYDMNKIIQHLQQEQGTASNIKDARTRKNVIDSLEKAIRHLRLFKRTPENGLALFAGNASSEESKIDIRVWSIEPPTPLKVRLYRCDQEFVLDLLRDMLEHRESYGLLVMDKREANIGFLKGTAIVTVTRMTSDVPGKFKTGGQSQQRFARIREELAREFYKKIGEAMNKTFLGSDVRGIIIGGPGHTKNEFFDGPFLNNEVKKKVLGLKDLSYTGEFGMHELVDKSHDVLTGEEIIREKNIVQKLLELLAKKPELVTYGETEVRRVLESNAVETLLISEATDEKIIDEFMELGEKSGAEILIISLETQEGQQLRDLGKVAAILRYAI